MIFEQDMAIIFLIFSVSIFLSITIALIERRRYNKIIRTKDKNIVAFIREQDQLKKELEYINVEKKVLEKMVREKFEAILIISKKRKKSTTSL